MSYETVRRVLAAAEITLSRPPHKISNPDPDYQVKKRRLLFKTKQALLAAARDFFDRANQGSGENPVDHRL